MFVLRIIKLPGLLCYNACIANAVANLNMPYGYLFYNSFHLKYYENSLSNQKVLGDRFLEGKQYYIGTCISTGENEKEKNKYLLNAEKLFHMQVDSLSIQDLDALRGQLSKGNIIGISTSTYWCSWLPGYHKEDIYHMVLANDVTNENFIECIDPMQASTFTYMNLEDYVNGTKELKVFQFSPCSLKAEELLAASLEELQAEQMVSDFRRFIRDIEQTPEFYKEFDLCNEGFWSCDLYRNLYFYIGGSRNLYGLFLKAISEQLHLPGLQLLIDRFSEVYQLWKSIKPIFLKNYYMQDFHHCQKELARRLNQIADLEEGIATEMIKLR